MKRRGLWFVLSALALFLIGVGILWPAPTSGGSGEETATPTPTPTLCPLATREPLWVEPVVATTDQFAQTIVVYIGNGEAVTVTSESGTYSEQGAFDAYAHPASVEIALRPGLTHHLTVYGRVRTVVQDECVYGGYALVTMHDRYGGPLIIRQMSEVRTVLYLPLVFR